MQIADYTFDFLRAADFCHMHVAVFLVHQGCDPLAICPEVCCA